MNKDDIDAFLGDVREKLYRALENGERIEFDGALVFASENGTEMLLDIVGKVITIRIGETDGHARFG